MKLFFGRHCMFLLNKYNFNWSEIKRLGKLSFSQSTRVQAEVRGAAEPDRKGKGLIHHHNINRTED